MWKLQEYIVKESAHRIEAEIGINDKLVWAETVTPKQVQPVDDFNNLNIERGISLNQQLQIAYLEDLERAISVSQYRRIYGKSQNKSGDLLRRNSPPIWNLPYHLWNHLC
jgi:hypothetical protein